MRGAVRPSAAVAAYRLVTCWLPYLFYTCPGTGRGRVLYRRYDGDLGLLLPAAR